MERLAAEHPQLEQAAAYALDAIDADERREFETHLVGCAICRAEVTELRAVAAALAHTAPVEAPPDALRARVLREARASREAYADVVSRHEAKPTRASAADVVPLRRHPRLAAAAPWLAAAAAVVVAIGIGWQASRERVARRVAERYQADAESRVAALRTELASRDSLLGVVLSPAVTTAKLAATGQAPSMQLVWHRTARMIVLSAADLPPAKTGRTYQLWGLDAAGTPHSLGTFNTQPDGHVMMVMKPSAAMMSTIRVSAVTEEPMGGSPQPTSQPFLVGRWG
jgi:hypothetical protein